MGDYFEISTGQDIPIKMKLTNMVNKQIPYPYTNTALLMSYDWNFIFKRSWFARYMVVSAGIGTFVFFQFRKIEIAFHDKCKKRQPLITKASYILLLVVIHIVNSI